MELKKRLIELLDNLNFEYGNMLADCYENNVENYVPPVEFFAEKLIANGVTIRKRGERKFNKDGSGTCNRCRITQMNVWDSDNYQNFCGHCGADMRGGKDE